MKLFLIRHGETVDNVAGVYAGVRDSALTNHGILQANRLGQHFASSGLRFTKIFSSNLQRAFKTAEAIKLAQLDVQVSKPPSDSREIHAVEMTRLPILREQDFGFYEGKPFYARSRESKKTGKEAHHDLHKNDPGFQDVESKEAMTVRMNSFLNEHLLPLLRAEAPRSENVVAIVSHGIILSTLWRCLLRRFAPRTVSLIPGLLVEGMSLEHLGGWSNTGYLELDINHLDINLQIVEPSTTELAVVEKPNRYLHDDDGLAEWRILIKVVNGKDHLKGVKRARGGIGSSKFDEGQKTIESFFKKQKVRNS
ncbi:MAG: hypothetical protein M1827_005120 [Pycnora praestabilis]|nr:MAG: hypothetical protein M1827_005120 [Pycnora praestabilis]